ncbi:MAG TPA: AMP-binding protein, partial [Steroidobacteraceae bacterium]|nr:AMP-binding protein [Steroidobacteraceae bacterium]
MPDYAAARREFTWDAERARLTAGTDKPLNIARICLDRQVAAGRGSRLAVRYIDRAGVRHDFDYAALLARVNRCANVLRAAGVGRGEAVFGLLGRGPALHVAALGAMKAGAVFCPLFSAFGPEPLATRMQIGNAVALVTTATLYRRKVAALRPQLPGLRLVFVLRDGTEELPLGTLDFDAALAAAQAQFDAATVGDEDIALMHFTSGTTGKPKGVLLAHEAVVAHHATARLALDLHP